MKKVRKITNNLPCILKKKNMTQKELADRIQVTEAVISDFVNMKRTSVNIELINKIVTEMKDEISSISDVFSITETIELEIYEANKLHKSKTRNNTYFKYSNNSKHVHFETFEVLDDGRVFVSLLRIQLCNFTPKKISKRFESYESSSDDLENEDLNKEIVFIHKLTILAIYEGILKEVQKYKDKEEAINKIESTYL